MKLENLYAISFELYNFDINAAVTELTYVFFCTFFIIHIIRLFINAV